MLSTTDYKNMTLTYSQKNHNQTVGVVERCPRSDLWFLNAKRSSSIFIYPLLIASTVTACAEHETLYRCASGLQTTIAYLCSYEYPPLQGDK